MSGGRAASPHVHVVGAGLAGLAAALDLSEAGLRVTLHEASPKAGGRCRSYHDPALDRCIDNGNHLILSGNAAVLGHAARIGAADQLRVLPDAGFGFVDIRDGRRWQVRVPRWPWGALAADARPPGVAGVAALGSLAALLGAWPGRTVAEAVRGRGEMWRLFWVPMTTAVMNAAPERASATLLRAALLRTVLRGAAACRPVVAPGGLGAALIDPALNVLATRGVELRLRSQVLGLAVSRGRAEAMAFADGSREGLGPGSAVVIAVPPAAMAALLPDAPCPGPGQAILNAHFRVPPEVAAAAPRLLGLISSQAQWIFARGDVLSVTVSAAEDAPVWGMARDDALATLWAEVGRALDLPPGPPLARRLLRERSATFDQSPRGAAQRPATRTALANVVLAGDHVATGLPATLEGAVRSGHAAARAILER